jgi:hypothetical protein
MVVLEPHEMSCTIIIKPGFFYHLKKFENFKSVTDILKVLST